MAVIALTQVTGVNTPVVLQTQTLTASDTLGYSGGKGQCLELDNTTAGALTVNLAGSTAGSIFPTGYGGPFSLAGGFNIAVPAGVKKLIQLDTISPYLSGIVTLTGAAGLNVRFFQ